MQHFYPNSEYKLTFLSDILAPLKWYIVTDTDYEFDILR